VTTTIEVTDIAIMGAEIMENGTTREEIMTAEITGVETTDAVMAAAVNGD
jgi:hypothetical protein